MDYILITLGYTALILLISYNILTNGHEKKPTPKVPTYSFLSGANPPAPPPAVVDKPIVPAELARRKLLLAGGLAAGVIGLMIFVSIPVVAKVSALIGGVGIGFLFAVIRYNHWDDVMREAYKPKPDKMTAKYAILYVVLISTFNFMNIRISNALSSSVSLTLMLAGFLIFSALWVGFLGEHLLLYLLYRQNERSLDGDPS